MMTQSYADVDTTTKKLEGPDLQTSARHSLQLLRLLEEQHCLAASIHKPRLAWLQNGGSTNPGASTSAVILMSWLLVSILHTDPREIS